MEPSIVLVVATGVGTGVLVAWYAAHGWTRADFGRVPPSWHAYLVVAALVANACLLALIALLASGGKLSAATTAVATTAVLAYVALQMAFAPLARTAVQGRIARAWTRATLVAAIVPVVVLVSLAARRLDRRPLPLALGATAMAHVVVNDALLFGATF